MVSRRHALRAARPLGLLADVRRASTSPSFPMHITGLIGMPRRVWTYPARHGLGHAQPDLDRRRLRARGRRAAVRRRSRAALPAGQRRPANPGTPARSNGCRATSTRRAAFRTSPAASRCGTSPNLAAEVEAGQPLPARCADRRPRDDRHVADRGAAAIRHPHARAGLDPVPRGGLHRRLLPAADGQARRAGARSAACWPIVACLVWAWELDPGPGTGAVAIGGGIGCRPI